jgi:hypothetical protein
MGTDTALHLCSDALRLIERDVEARMSNGSHRIPRPTRPQELAEVRAAAQDIAQQAEHAGRAGRLLQNIANMALIGTALASGALAAVHLWRTLRGKPHPPQGVQRPQTTVAEGPPRRRTRAVVATGAEDGPSDRWRQAEDERRQNQARGR